VEPSVGPSVGPSVCPSAEPSAGPSVFSNIGDKFFRLTFNWKSVDSRNMKNSMMFLLVCLGLVFLSGCADANTLVGQIRDGANAPAGFWRGLWHGICAPFSLIGIMFGMDIGVYEYYNTGNWYNFGFLLGCGALGVSWKSSSSSEK
jgi:hypothetical protein